MCSARASAMGLSPRVRGNRTIEKLAEDAMGITGLSPRVRGNRSRFVVQSLACLGIGLSPRVRGKPRLGSLLAERRASVYPRVYGETSSNQ